jgi:hypothetical protein
MVGDDAARASAAVDLLGPLFGSLVAEAVAVVGNDHAAVTALILRRLALGRAEDRDALAAVHALKGFDLDAKQQAEGWAPDARYPGGWRPPEALPKL